MNFDSKKNLYWTVVFGITETNMSIVLVDSGIAEASHSLQGFEVNLVFEGKICSWILIPVQNIPFLIYAFYFLCNIH